MPKTARTTSPEILSCEGNDDKDGQELHNHYIESDAQEEKVDSDA